MDKGVGYLIINGYGADTADKYARQCAIEWRFPIVVRFRDGQADLEWDYIVQYQHNALTGENQEVVKIWFRGFYERYATELTPHRGIIGYGAIDGLTREMACKAALELNTFLTIMLQQYKKKRSCHGK